MFRRNKARLGQLALVVLAGACLVAYWLEQRRVAFALLVLLTGAVGLLVTELVSKGNRTLLAKMDSRPPDRGLAPDQLLAQLDQKKKQLDSLNANLAEINQVTQDTEKLCATVLSRLTDQQLWIVETMQTVQALAASPKTN